MTDSLKIAVSLLILRLATAAFFLVWALEKVVAPELAQRVFETFYLTAPTIWQVIAIGLVQLAIVLAFLVGWLRFWSYGAVLVMHAVSTLSTYERLLNPYEPPNHLFWAAVPLLAAILLLFILRAHDRLLSVDSMIAARRTSQRKGPARAETERA